MAGGSLQEPGESNSERLFVEKCGGSSERTCRATLFTKVSISSQAEQSNRRNAVVCFLAKSQEKSTATISLSAAGIPEKRSRKGREGDGVKYLEDCYLRLLR